MYAPLTRPSAQLLRDIPPPASRMPARFQNTFTFCRHFGHVLRYDEESNAWTVGVIRRLSLNV